MFLRRRLLSTAAAAAAARGPPPIRVSLTESAGRGVFATRPVSSGELLHSAQPLVSHPSQSLLHEVCYKCLRRKPGEGRGSNGGDYFCSDACRDHTKMKEEFELLESTFRKAGFQEEVTNFLTVDWYINVLARIRINAFRIELVASSYEDLLSSAAASVSCDSSVGNAVYMLPSFYNHDCDPNAHIVWLDNADAKLKALRDIEEGEELRICYIDASLDADARQKILGDGFGFECHCLRCLSGD